MYVLWGGDVLAADLRSDLAQAGADRLVVEVDDQHVADAQLRLSTYGEPVHAVLSVWTEADPAAVTEVLAARSDNLAGWVVEERLPLPPPKVAGGGRVDGLLNVALLRIPAGMPRDRWLEQWLDHHTTVAIETQATTGYVQ